MRSKISIMVSVIAAIGIYLGLNFVAEEIGIPTYIDYGGPVTITHGSGRYSYDDEVTGGSTDFGFYIMILSVMLAWRLYHLVDFRLGGEPLRDESKASWFQWLAGFTAYISITTPIWFLEFPSFVVRIASLVVAAAIAFLFYAGPGKKYCQRIQSALTPSRLKNNKQA
ncbi:hypothetical protein [Azotobacter vinelandii]